VSLRRRPRPDRGLYPAAMTELAGGTLLRLAAFTTDPSGGNPAGVWIGDAFPADDAMLGIAADVGYSESAFLVPAGDAGTGRFRVRYFSPLAEVPFCGHATIASGVALADRGLASPAADGTRGGSLVLETNGGPVAVTAVTDDDRLTALELLGWRASELDPALPPAVGFAGVKHLILAAADRERLERLDYPFEPVKALMLRADLTTIQLVWREAVDRFRARDPFPVGGMVEDPATGAAAAALGAYLRQRGEIVAPATFEVIQGVEMGRPSLITVSIVPGEKGVRVSGTAVLIG
jgi:predicted PhzF superfamily epimerase YddE/YHI9